MSSHANHGFVAPNADLSRRPCDHCRRGKQRCDGFPNRDCSRCSKTSKVCSYDNAPLERYITELESRLRAVEALLQKHVPQALLMQELATLTMNTAFNSSPTRYRTDGISDFPKVATSLPALERWDGLMALTHQQHALDSPDGTAPSQAAETLIRRPEFWCIPECEFRKERPEKRALDLVLPPPDQLASCVQVYFETWNPIVPMLHRPLFEHQLLNNKPNRDKRFGVVLMLMCALAENRFAGRAPQDPHPPGWKYFNQAEPYLRMPTPAEPQLYDVQAFFLASLYAGFFIGNCISWSLLGTAIRLAYLANAHRRARYNSQQPNLLDELWKRTFWTLVVIDRIMACRHGRPLLIRDETFDLELPLEVDDESWDLAAVGYPLRDNLSTNPTQCLYGFFIATIRLTLILGVCIQTIYPNNRSRLLMGFVGSDWERQITSKIDHMLDEWATALPIHLRWDPNAADLNRFAQSAFLNVRYHTLTVNAHNPFMRTTARDLTRAAPSSKTVNDVSSSLAICTAAAVQCSEVLMAVLERHPRCLGQPCWVDPPFVCGLVLLVNLFGFGSDLSKLDTERLITCVQTCLEALTIISADDSDAVPRRETLRQLFEELKQELTPRLSVESVVLHWPENRAIPIFPLGAASDEVHRPFCLDAIPPDLRHHISTNLWHQIQF
ncbi:fungal-specific transcription factor domain-containing protein [Auriculariales sp. MPI-PUGE-AT-0066]|nr:fungal-specific transcription factor domain-containing protein [Auriculariales sp. MPI-PUGE-AT-0066]